MDGAAAGALGQRDRIAALCAAVTPPDRRQARLAQVRQLTLARPAGSLGRLDELVCRVAAIRRTPTPGPLPAVVSVLAGDHGIATRGTSAFPQRHTGAVLRLIQAGQAPVNILAGRVPARVESADFGLVDPVGGQRYRVAAGTGDISRQDAMTLAQAGRAVLNGADYAVARLGHDALLGVGEIGVGNTTATAALAARLIGASPGEIVGVGSGVDPAVVRHKRDLVEAALRRVGNLPDEPLRLLAALGGFEIAGNVGLILAAAGRGQVVVVDGTMTAMSHRLLLDALGQPPLLTLDMRLGMGAGAALALGLVNAALAVAERTPVARAVGLEAVR